MKKHILEGVHMNTYMSKKFLSIIGCLAVMMVTFIIAGCSDNNPVTAVLDNKPTVANQLRQLKPYMDAANTFNTYSTKNATMIQPTMDQLRSGEHNSTIVLPPYADLQTALKAAQSEGSSGSKEVDEATTNVLTILQDMVPVSKELEDYYKNQTFTKDNYMGSDSLAAKLIPMEEKFTVAYNTLDLAITNYHKELNDTRVKDFQADRKENAVKFIQINMLMSETIDMINPDGTTDVKKVEANLKQITNSVNTLEQGTTTATQKAVKEYQDAVRQFITAAQSYITVNSTFLEAYNQLFDIYNATMNKADAVNMDELDKTK